MKKVVKVLMLCMLACVQSLPNLKAQSLHAIVFCNTLDKGIGCDVDEENMLNELAIIAGETNLTYKPYVKHGEECTKTNLLKVIDELNCSSNDVIFMYYSGHGAHSAQQMNEPFPQLCMKYNSESYQSQFVSVKTVDEHITRKNPRLSIIITDCCNNVSNSLLPRTISGMKGATVENTTSVDALGKLFVRSRGKVKITSSKLTQTSLGSGKTGGLFTNAFIDVLADIEDGKCKADWQTLAQETRKVSLSRSGNRQEPYAEIHVEMLDAVVPIQNSATASNPTASVPNSTTTPLAQHLQFLLDKTIPEAVRLGKIMPILQECFTPNAKVKTVGRNLTTIVAYEDAEEFLRRIIASPYIKVISIVKQAESGKNTEVIVHELRTQ